MMRVLLDENIPRKLKWRFDDVFEVVTVPERGWSGVTNGELLRRAQQEFDVLVTMDQGLPHQQNLKDTQLGIIIVSAPTNEYEVLLPLMAEIEIALRAAQPGKVVTVPE